MTVSQAGLELFQHSDSSEVPGVHAGDDSKAKSHTSSWGLGMSARMAVGPSVRDVPWAWAQLAPQCNREPSWDA